VELWLVGPLYLLNEMMGETGIPNEIIPNWVARVVSVQFVMNSNFVFLNSN